MPDPAPIPGLDAPTIATDGDISVEYMQTLITYLQGEEDGGRIPAAASDDSASSLFTSAMQEVKGLWGAVGSFFSTALTAVSQYQETKQAFLTLWTATKKEWATFVEGRDLDEPTDDGRQRTSLVVTLRDGQEAIESFRIGKLKTTLKEQTEKIEEQIELIKTRAKSLTDGAAAYGGRASASGMVQAGAAINELELAGSQARDIMDQLLVLIKLFDLFGDIEDDLADKVLGQSKPQQLVTVQVSTRNPAE